jgi:hypothetical protein
MKSIAQRLGNEDWPLIDVTLKQFALPWTDQWSGTKEGYVLEMIEGAADDALLDLGRHVGFQLQEPHTACGAALLAQRDVQTLHYALGGSPKVRG